MTFDFNKTFYYTTEVISKSKMYGCQKIACRIYKLREEDGAMIQLGACSYNTAATCGTQNEVFQWLRANSYIDEQYTGTYFYDSGAYEVYKIYSIS